MRKFTLLICICLWFNSSYAEHIVNGSFDVDEWDMTKPTKGIYSYFYFAWENNDLYIMNDWYNTDPGFQLQDDQWNTFLFDDSQGDNWEFRVYNNGNVTAWENGTPYFGAGIVAQYGFGPSPNKPENHTLYEAKIEKDILGMNFFPRIKEKDPRRLGDIGDGGWVDGPFSTVPEPNLLYLLSSGLAGILFFGRKNLFKKV